MYTSGKFSEAKGKRSSTKLEILGIINSLNSFHLYIQNYTFIIRTDCNNIIEFYKKSTKEKL